MDGQHGLWPCKQVWIYYCLNLHTATLFLLHQGSYVNFQAPMNLLDTRHAAQKWGAWLL